MPRFYFQESTFSPASAADCVNAAWRALASKGGKPVVQGSRVTGKLGSQLKMRIIGGAFAPLSWLPTDIVIDVVEAGGQRQIVVNVAERIGFGIALGMETRMKTHCYNMAVALRDSIALQLMGAH